MCTLESQVKAPENEMTWESVWEQVGWVGSRQDSDAELLESFVMINADKL